MSEQEAERTAFFLAGMASQLGRWQQALPAASMQLREAASAFLAFAALPALDTTSRIHCGPVSPSERVIFKTHTANLTSASVVQPSFEFLMTQIPEFATHFINDRRMAHLKL